MEMKNTMKINELAMPGYPMLQVVGGLPMTTSMVVSEIFGKRHDHVLRDIEVLIEDLRSQDYLPNFGEVIGSYFQPISHDFTNGKGGIQTAPAYRMTRDGFTLLAMGFTGKEALKFKIAYIEAFNRMEARLHKTPAVPVLKMDKKAAQEAWSLFREVVADNKAAGMDDITAWTAAGSITKEATGADMLEHLGHPHLGYKQALQLALKTDTKQAKGARGPVGIPLDWKQRMALRMAITDLVKAAPEKFHAAYVAEDWLAKAMHVLIYEDIEQHRFIEALNILRVRAECERAA